MNNLLFENESLDDLQINNLYIIQKNEGFRFGTDAVLLSDFAKDAVGNSLLDLCCGCGIVPLLLSAKTAIDKIYGLEIQEDIAQMAKRSVLLNKLNERIFISCGDLKLCKSYYTPHSFDAVTINPPYMKASSNITNELDCKTIARHEVLCNIDDCARACADMLKYHGSMFMIHKPDRLIDIIFAMRKYKIEPKLLRFVYSKPECEPSMLLIKGSYCGGSQLKILPPLYIHDENGELTDQIRKIYGKEL